MDVELQINNSANAAARFVGWTPAPCRIRVSNPAGTTAPTVSVTLSIVAAPGGGAVHFRSGTTGTFSDTLDLSVPTGGASVSFFVAGKFGQASTNPGDITVEARNGGAVVGSTPVMVRVPKNAVNLTTQERDRFIAAMAQLNNQGLGRFRDFRDMHVDASDDEMHHERGFLPWHRAYLLDLERELQAIDASVALPYWSFDQPAPSIFTLEFLGVANQIGTVQFGPNNPLRFWTTDGVLGVNRRPRFNTASQTPPGILSEAVTLALGGTFTNFRLMEGNPHGTAHVGFGGSIHDPGTAPKDPLFFLLHCNVDRLWAKWQRQNTRFDPSAVASYDNSSSRIGHRLSDTMWPLNMSTVPPPPPFPPPGGTLAPSPFLTAPGLAPRVRDLIDYPGTVTASPLGFDYDDVPS